ncbi:MAG: hypothetical protein O2923_11225 [Verrucomicrobia bacterium]|nr:hypothetical protein [Verrucomicrobiota bacterium]MDA1088101.1 hypothetical protein [Verrucomicrobiota bacterium]
MKIVVGGEDRSDVVGGMVTKGVERMRRHPDAPEFVHSTYSALALCEATTTSAYLHRLIDLIRKRSELSTIPARVPHGQGLVTTIKAQIRWLMWRVLRYQHDRMAFQQNVINTQMTSALEFLVEEQSREIAELRARLDAREGNA